MEKPPASVTLSHQPEEPAGAPPPHSCTAGPPRLTGIEDGLQRLDVCGHPRYPVDANLLDAPLLHLLHTLPHDVGHLGALPPGVEVGDVREGRGRGPP
uniref:Uncharacterized protein n=1 Tax=Moschus moschiferus TaxID=68415 RepID=A0A8C6DIT3_MOSMO